jgi:LAO/AO transport system kinase
VEVDIVKAADTTILVLTPGAGDEIQMMKAGILEAADILAVNKVDKEGAACLKTDLESMLAMKSRAPGEWLPPVILTEAVNDKGTDAMAELTSPNTSPGGPPPAGKAKLELLETVESRLKEMVAALTV